MGVSMTLKKAILRGLLGFPIGIFMGYTITLLISIVEGSGMFYPVVPQLTVVTGNEINAVMLQYLLSGVLGFAFAVGSAIFEVEKWGITKQMVSHFVICTTAMFPIAYFCYWMEHTIWGILYYILMFASMYLVIGIIQYQSWKKKIKLINGKLQNK